MATVKATTVKLLKNVVRVVWANITNTDNVGSGEGLAQYPDKSVQVFGTFGGATLAIEGSNDGGTTWGAVHDGQGNAVSFTAAGIEAIAENVDQVRPSLTGGAGTTVQVYLVARGVG